MDLVGGWAVTKEGEGASGVRSALREFLICDQTPKVDLFSAIKTQQRTAQLKVFQRSPRPLGPLGFNFSQLGSTTRPSVERTAEKAFMLSDRV